MKLIESVTASLKSRGNKPRSGTDDELFLQFNTFIAIVAGQGLERFIIDTYREIEKAVNEFEISQTTEIHKGSIFFNIGLIYLWSGDFDNALYYWEKAEDENKKTYGIVKYNIFTGDLFQKNFGKIIQTFMSQELAKESMSDYLCKRLSSVFLSKRESACKNNRKIDTRY